MRKILSFFAVLIAAVSLQAQSVVKVGDTFSWSGMGDQYNYSYTYRVLTLPSGSTPGNVEIISYSVSGVMNSSTFVVDGDVELNYSGSKKMFVLTKIGDNAFKTCPLQNLILIYQTAETPSSIEIGVSAFSGCTSLQSIRAGNGAWTNNAWKNIDIANFGNIGSQAFYNCSALTMNIVCGKAVQNSGTNVTYSIGANAFYNCSKITQLTCGGSNIDKTAFTGCSGIVLVAWLGGTSSITSETNSPFYQLRNNTMWVGIYGSVPAYWFRNCTGITYINMPEDIWSYSSVYNTSIGAYAFGNCTNLMIANVGGKVDGNAFYGCTGMTSVTWRGGDPGITAPNMSIFRSSADKITSFSFLSTSGSCSVPSYICCGLTKIKSVTIPANTGGNIGNCAFQECTALETVDFDGDYSSYFSEIGNYAFYKCSALKTITTNKTEGLPKMIYKIGNNAFASCTALTTGLSEKNTNISEIGTNAFYSSGIEKLVIPASTWTISMGKEIAGGYNSKVTEIDYLYTGTLTRANAGGSYANVFLSANSSYQSYRNKVTKLVINKEVKNIPDSLFYNYQGIAAINDQNGATTVSGVEKIGVASFYNCKALTTFKSKALTTIGESAFENSGFESSVFNTVQMNAVTTIGDKAFKNTKVKSFVSNGHTNYVTSLTKIGKEAFANCSQLEQVTIPAEVTSIGTDAFAGCSALKTIYWNAKDFGSSNPFGSTIAAQITVLTISDDVTKIPADFLVGSQIKNITFPTGIKTIGARAFKNTASLDSISFLAYNGQVEVSVSSASDAPFAGSSLKIAYMPQSITTVPSWLLAGTSKLEKMYVSASAPSFASNALNGAGLKELSLTNVQNIGSKSFANMTALKTIYLNGSVPTPKSDSFSGTNNVQTIVTSCANYSDVYNNSTWKAVCSNIKNSESQYDNTYLAGLIDDSFWMTNGTIEIVEDIDCEGHVTLKVVPSEGCTFLYWDDGNNENPRRFDLSTWWMWRIGGICASESDWYQQHFSIVPAEAGYLTATNEYGHDRNNLKFVKNEQAILKANVTNDWYEFKEWQWDSNTMNTPSIGDPNNWGYQEKDMCYFYINYEADAGGDMGSGDMGMGGMTSGYQKVTSEPSDWSGTYCIVFEDPNDATKGWIMDGSLEKMDAAGNNIEVSIDNGLISDEASITYSTFTIEPNGTGYAIHNQSGVYINNTTTGNTLQTSGSMGNPLSISIIDGAVEIVTSSNAHLRYNASSGQERFRFFKEGSYSAQKPIQLYRYSSGGDINPDPWSPTERPMHDEYLKAVCSVKAIDVAIELSTNGGGYIELETASVKLGDEITVTAKPAEGYIFKEWGNKATAATTKITIDVKDLKKRIMMGSDPETMEPMWSYENVWNGSTLEPFDPGAEYVYEVYAVFQADPNYKKSYTITAESLDMTKGTVTGGGVYEEGSQATLTATPVEGYQFSVWSDGVSANPRVVTVTKDETFTAIFTEKTVELPTYILTVNSSNDAWGSASGSGEYEEGQTIQIVATANEGYEFVQWSDGNTDNPRTIVVKQDLTLTAEFKEIPSGFDNVEAETIKARKVMIDGTIYIIRGDKMYNILGTEIR